MIPLTGEETEEENSNTWGKDTELVGDGAAVWSPAL